MWLFTRYGFYSVACASKPSGALDPDTLMIRGRRKAHLQKLQARFPLIADAEIVSLQNRDYRYRIIVPKDEWLKIITEMAREQTWSNFKSEAAQFQGTDGSEYVDAMHRVWDMMYGLQRSENQRLLVQRSADGAITNADELDAADIATERVLCPACHKKVFASWPEGWDGHAGYACIIGGETPEERKAAFKQRFRRLFR
jgi:hypothetical protein